MATEKELTELLHDASDALGMCERADTKKLERQIDDVLLASPHVIDADKALIRDYWSQIGGAP